MKLNNYLLLKLEQFYNSTLNEPQGWADSAEDDVPNIKGDKEYKTFMIFPALEDIEEPELKTKKGKNILREPPGDPDANPEDIDVDMLDSKGNEIDDCEEDDVYVDEQLVSEAYDDDEESDQTSTNQDQMSEQNPESGTDPNISDPTQQPADPNSLAGGQGGMGAGFPPDVTGGMDTGGGMGYEPPKSAEQIGRIFELKKIYSRLLSIESQLSFSADLTLVKLRKYISKAIEFFEILIANENSFKDEFDDIIIKYYTFLDQVYTIIKHYYQQQKQEEKEKP